MSLVIACEFAQKQLAQTSLTLGQNADCELQTADRK